MLIPFRHSTMELTPLLLVLVMLSYVELIHRSREVDRLIHSLEVKLLIKVHKLMEGLAEDALFLLLLILIKTMSTTCLLYLQHFGISS